MKNNLSPIINILIVEDDESNRAVIKKSLETKGFNIIESENGREALKILKTYKPDLILMDILMPTMNGYETTRIIKNKKEWKNIPIVAFTALATRNDKEQALAAGCDAYICKPITGEELSIEIKKILKK